MSNGDLTVFWIGCRRSQVNPCTKQSQKELRLWSSHGLLHYNNTKKYVTDKDYKDFNEAKTKQHKFVVLSKSHIWSSQHWNRAKEEHFDFVWSQNKVLLSGSLWWEKISSERKREVVREKAKREREKERV